MEEEIKNPNDSENKIKLYSLLVDQLLKYEATIWQIPTALAVGNFLVIEKFFSNPYVLSGLALFNFGLIFVFYRMIKTQRFIINATVNAEKNLGNIYKDYLPAFKKHSIPAPYLFIGILLFLELFLIVYIIFLFINLFCRC